MKLSNSDTLHNSTKTNTKDASSVIGEALRLLVHNSDISPNLANSISLLELFEAFSNRNDLSKQFVSRNKKVYNQEYSAQQFVCEYYKKIKLALPQTTLIGDEFVERQFVYLFGIPVFVVANTLPWSVPESYDTQVSKWVPGIICIDSPDLVNEVRIEIMRVILDWFKAGNVFKKQELMPNISADRVYIKTRRDIVEHTRSEIILQLTANPGFLSSKDDFELTPYLAAGTNLQLIQSIPDDFYSQFRQVVDIVKLVDSSQYKQLSRKKMCQIMYTKTDCPAILQAVKNHIN